MSAITPRTSKRSKRPKIPFGEEDESNQDKSENSGLKLVLKVTGSAKSLDTSNMSNVGSETEDSDAERLKSKKKKKKTESSEPKKKRGHEIPSFILSDDEATSQSRFAPTDEGSMMATMLDGDQSQSSLIMRGREKRSIPEDEKTPFRRCLEYLRNQIERKDTNGFFAFPVTDMIAPGYSSVISDPMDLNTMLLKIEKGLYPSINEFKADFELIMNNCMTYNHPDTVYYKEAKKLLLYGQKMLSKEKLMQLKRQLTYMSQVTSAELGFVDEPVPVAVSVATTSAPQPSTSITSTLTTSASMATLAAAESCSSLLSDKPSESSGTARFEAIPDDMTPEEILKQAQEAAKAAAGKLTLRAPNSKMGFLRRREDGSTSFNIVNPDNDGIVSEKERIVTLGQFVGKLTSGTGSVLVLKEDRRNRVNTVNYLDYGSFGSFAPYYDSSTANVSKDDSDLLLSTYYDETGVQYAKSIRHFVENAGDYALSMVDNLLDLVTSNDHRKTMEILRQREEERKKLSADFNDLMPHVRTDLDNKVDLTFLTNAEAVVSSDEDNPIIQKQLNLTSQLISELVQTQYSRLSQTLPENLSQIPGPSPAEVQLAHSVTTQLTQLIKQIAPSDVVSRDELRAAMGITDSSDWSDNQAADFFQYSAGSAVTAAADIQNQQSCNDAKISLGVQYSGQTGFNSTGQQLMTSGTAAVGHQLMTSSAAVGQQLMTSGAAVGQQLSTSGAAVGQQLSTSGAANSDFVLDPEMQELLEQSSIVCLDS